ncbi:MAG: TIGR04219 family outer membrane beta-barrel protein [Gammaproteobacteria bacterium]|nr:TIGR04219 family outer membrane beta-barrel protein [Gammaproteobacteria bacterium]
MKLHALSIAVLAAGLTVSAQADTLGLKIGGGSWDHDPSGTIRYKSTLIDDDINLDNDLHLKEKKEGYFFVVIEHPIPVLPNIRIMSTKLSSHGDGTTTKAFTFNNESYSLSENIVTDLVLDQTDLTLYYELLDNVVSLDLGLNLKNIDGSARLVGATAGTNTATFDVTIPMLYASVGISPIEGLFIGAEVSYIGYDGNSISDYTAKVAYTSDYLIGIEAGVRSQSYELDDIDDSYGNMEFTGPFIGAYLHF